MIRIVQKIVLCLVCTFCGIVYAESGNFLLNPALQPGPFFGFGQMLIPARTYQWQNSFEILRDTTIQAQLLTESGILGITDNLAVAATFPYFFRYKEDGVVATGLSDISIQLETSIYEGEKAGIYSDQATLYGSVVIPHGRSNGAAAISQGVNSYFLGLTFNRMYAYWYIYTAIGGEHFARKPNLDLGNIYHFHAGIGHTFYAGKESLFMLLVELDATSTNKTRFGPFVDQNSGGNLVDVSPSISYVYKALNIQAGYSIPAYQKWNDRQFKRRGTAMLMLTWSFI